MLRQFEGLCAQYLNEAIDFAISMNLWPVRFVEPDGTKSELVTQFTIGVWAKYCTKMAGKPKPASNACQLVFKYLLLNPEKLAKAWRPRLYYYSSGSVFQQISGDLQQYLLTHGDKGKKWIRQIKNEHDLWELIADAMFEFMKLNQQPFPNVTCSKEDFWLVPTWKRAMLFLFLSRFLLEMPAQKPWNKFVHTDIKFNMRAIKRYLAVDEYIFEYCDDFVQLPDVHDQTNEKAPKKRKISMLVSDGQSDSPVKRTFEVQDASTEEDTSDDGDNDE